MQAKISKFFFVADHNMKSWKKLPVCRNNWNWNIILRPGGVNYTYDNWLASMFYITKVNPTQKITFMEDFEVQNKSTTLLQRNQTEDLLEKKLAIPSDCIWQKFSFQNKKGNKKEPHTVLLLLSCSNIMTIKPDF